METSQFDEAFAVFLQALISQCLDANFLQEVYSEQDEYFLASMEKVEKVTRDRKAKILTGNSWAHSFQQSLDTWPILNDLGSAAVQVSYCN